jgi:PAS domain-containing serine/threonine kinase
VDTCEPRPYYKLFYGTTAYASAEILRKQTYQAAPAEIWTLGVLLSFLLTGSSPFPTVKDAIEGRIAFTDCPKVSNAVLDLMRVCLDPDPKARATIDEVKNHPWLNPERL